MQTPGRSRRTGPRLVMGDATRVRATVLVAALLGIGGLGCSDAFGPLDSLPRDLTPAERAVSSSANDFGLALFHELAADQPGENLFFSPLSAYLALGMTANGAAGPTLDAMRATLRQGGLTEPEANEAYRSLVDLLLGLDPRVEFTIANSIWYRLGLPVRPDFVELSRGTFDAEVRGLDFDDPASVEIINGWVEERTAGRIKELVAELEPQDVMLLINAIYFKGDWEEQFDPERTRDAPFRLLDGSYVEAPMMTRRDVKTLRYQEREAFTAVDLLYGRGAFSMTVILPAEGTAPADLMAAVDPATWDEWMAGFEETDRIGQVELPKFRLEWEKSLEDALRALGMGIAFGDADFSRLAEGGEGLYISDVRQKAFVDVNEEGTEAAAATSVSLADRGVPTFRADRPFLFAIRERFSGTVLFLGQLLDPSQAQGG